MNSESTAFDLYDLLRSKGRTTADAGIAQAHFIQIAKGRQEAGANAIRKIADHLGVTTEAVHAACLESHRRASAASPTAQQPAQDQG